jgi:hypothetical protein
MIFVNGAGNARALVLKLVDNISVVFEYLWSSHAESHGSCCTTVSVHLPNVTRPPLPYPPPPIRRNILVEKSGLQYLCLQDTASTLGSLGGRICALILVIQL